MARDIAGATLNTNLIAWTGETTIDSGDWTLVSWAYPRATGSGGFITTKNPANTNPMQWIRVNANLVAARQGFATTDTEVTASPPSLNKWALIVGLFDSTGSIGTANRCHLFLGDVDTPMAQPSESQTAPSGARRTGGTTYRVGNGPAGTGALDGLVGPCIVYNRLLTLAEAEQIRQGWLPGLGLNDPNLIFYTDLASETLARVVDTKNNINGTITGAAVAVGQGPSQLLAPRAFIKPPGHIHPVTIPRKAPTDQAPPVGLTVPANASSLIQYADDSFDRSNNDKLGTNTPISSGHSFKWRDVIGQTGIVSNSPSLTGNSTATAILPFDQLGGIAIADGVGFSDGTVEFQHISSPSVDGGIIFRYQDPANFWILYAVDGFAGANLDKVINGVRTNVVGGAAFSNSQIMGVTFVGSDIRVRSIDSNGSPIVWSAAEDASLMTATGVGIYTHFSGVNQGILSFSAQAIGYPIPVHPPGHIAPQTAFARRVLTAEFHTIIKTHSIDADLKQTITIKASSYSSIILADLPHGYWRLGDSSGPTAIDSSGNSYNGTYFNTPTLGQIGLIDESNTCIYLNSNLSQAVHLPFAASVYSISSKFVFEAWIKTTSNSFQPIIANDHTSNSTGAVLTVNNGAVTFNVYLTSGNYNITGGSVADGIRHHIVAIYQIGSVKLYIDGVSVGSSFLVGSGTDTTVSELSIGSSSGDFFFFNGFIDEVAIYNYELTASQIVAHYHAGAAPKIDASLVSIEAFLPKLPPGRIAPNGHWPPRRFGEFHTRIITSSIDAVLQKTLTISHLIDAVLKKTQTVTCNIDADLKQTTIITYLIDADLKQTVTKTCNVDADLKQTATITYLIDTDLKKIQTINCNIDADLKKTQIISHNIDADLKQTQIIFYNIDAVLKKTQTISCNVDADLKNTITITHLIDADLKKTQIITNNIDADLKKTQIIVCNIDADLKKTQTVFHQIDADLEQIEAGSYTVDAVLEQTQTVSGQIDAVLILKTINYQIDALLLTTITNTYQVNAVLKQTQIISGQIDADLKQTFIITNNIDADLLKTSTQQYLIDAVLKNSFTINYLTDALLQKTQSITNNIDGVLKNTFIQTYQIDADLKQRTTIQYNIDAELKSANTKLYNIDAVLKQTQTISGQIDSLLASRITISHLIDAVLKTRVVTTYSLDAVLEKSFTKTYLVNGVLKNSFIKTYNLDAVLKKRSTINYLVDADLKKISLIACSISAVLQKTFIRTHLVDAILKQAQTRTHQIDADLSRVKTYNIDGVLQNSFQRTYQLDAVLLISQSTSHAISAVLKRTVTISHQIDADLEKTQINQYLMDAIMVASVFFTVDISLNVRAIQITKNIGGPQLASVFFTVNISLNIRTVQITKNIEGPQLTSNIRTVEL